MTNFKINFSYPWLLLLLIPAALLTFIPYFRMNKRYRCTRNRIASMVLHCIVMVLAIAVLSGISFEYDIPNPDNEVILLVDASFSGEKSEQEKDDFIQSVIGQSNSMFKLGIVTFGFDQVYAAPLSENGEGIYAKYMQAPLPDTTATDIEAALNYTAGLFASPETARIILISDAQQTDGDVEETIKSIAAKGIKVDTVYFPNAEVTDEVRLVGMTYKQDKIQVGEAFDVELTVQSSYAGEVTITPYDNDAPGAAMTVQLTEGIQKITVPYSFALPGMHKMSFEMEASTDTLAQNNNYTSYIYLEIFDKILIIESIDDESKALCEALREELKVTVISVDDTEKMPNTLDALRAYDQVILCNVSNDDLPESFDQLLYSYVFDIGGGLFTICGNEQDSNPDDEDWTANAYTREDMYGTLYQEMLPVEAINYTPPVAVMIVIDSSGSMDMENDPENSKLARAKEGAEACLNALTERDYVGIMSLADSYEEHIELTPRPQRDKILAAIDEIVVGGQTVFSTALERAGKALAAKTDVEKRHIIIVTDGEPSGEDEQDYKFWFEENAKMGITVSIVGIQCTYSAQQNMIKLLEEHAGMTEKNFHAVDNLEEVATVMREDLEAPEIKDVNYTQFRPEIAVNSGITAGIKKDDIPMLDGFYGLKTKEGAQVILMGEYTPIYAQWQFGKGMVGTFGCDLNGTWSSEFIDSEAGKTIINNIVIALFPAENIQPKEIEVSVKGENYKSQLSVFTQLNEGEYIEITITSPAEEGQAEPLVQTFTANSLQGMNRINFVVKTPGIHEIATRKYDANGNLIAEDISYRALAYSAEYNPFVDLAANEELMKKISTRSNGVEISEPWEVFENAVMFLHNEIDPRIVLLITAMVLFLLDIAARKFKWKWPGEIIRDRKAKQLIMSKGK